MQHCHITFESTQTHFVSRQIFSMEYSRMTAIVIEEKNFSSDVDAAESQLQTLNFTMLCLMTVLHLIQNFVFSTF